MGSKKQFVAISNLGLHGRFGNQLFQYAFVKIYATRYSLQLQTRPWIGQFLFGHRDPPVKQPLQILRYDDLPDVRTMLRSKKPPVVNCDLWASIRHPNDFRAHKKLFRSIFRPTPEIHRIVRPGMTKLRERGETVVGIHIRRGDYLNYPNHRRYFPVPTSWYIRWLEQLWPTLDRPVLFIASDDPALVVRDFALFRPVTSADVIPVFPSKPRYDDLDPSFYPDFYILSQCDVLAISNSTFSFAASLLNTRCATFMRPHYSQQLIPFRPWKSEKKIRVL